MVLVADHIITVVMQRKPDMKDLLSFWAWGDSAAVAANHLTGTMTLTQLSRG